jgi:hypothetical protein
MALLAPILFAIPLVFADHALVIPASLADIATPPAIVMSVCTAVLSPIHAVSGR